MRVRQCSRLEPDTIDSFLSGCVLVQLVIMEELNEASGLGQCEILLVASEGKMLLSISRSIRDTAGWVLFGGGQRRVNA